MRSSDLPFWQTPKNSSVIARSVWRRGNPRFGTTISSDPTGLPRRPRRTPRNDRKKGAYTQVKYFFFLLFGVVFLSVPRIDVSAAPATPAHVAPKTINFYLKWTLSDEEARSLARWDLVILDMEVQSNNPSAIRLMRQLHPEIKILAYVAASEIRSDAFSLGSVAPLRRDLFSSIPDQWYVTDGTGNKKSFWSGTWIVNVTNQAPMVNGERWNAFLPRFVQERIVSTGLWDGVLYDNSWENITFFAGGMVDLNRDGQLESVAAADASWREGLRALYTGTRTRLPNALVLENDGPRYADAVHGLQFENFPNGGWSAVSGRIVTAGGAALAPRLIAVNTNTANAGNSTAYKKFRYGLASALLFDAYSGFDYGDQDHGQAWWYDEYDTVLGAPGPSPARLDGKGTGWQTGVWRRDYGRGTVVVNSGATEKTVRLSGEFERIHGKQDPAVNNGTIGNTITLAAQDGIVLLKPLGEVRGAAFTNGSFVRIFNRTGGVMRTGFFVDVGRFAPSATVMTRVAQGKNREVIVADGAHVRIYDESGKQRADITPYGPQFTGGISIATGDVFGDGSGVLITATRDSGGGIVNVFSLNGVLQKTFRAYDERYTGGANVAVGDLDGDGRAEIVVGAGTGGGPHIRIFRGDGTLVNGGFFAYDPKFRGGVRVAVGDLDGDGRAEIVAGAGVGGGPHVRVFSGRAELVSQFFAFDPSGRDGVQVGVGDIDSDGRFELLAFTKEVGGIAGISRGKPPLAYGYGTTNSTTK